MEGMERRHHETDVRRMNRVIKSACYWHGYLPRKDAVELLKVPGDFLLRQTKRGGAVEIVISICCSQNEWKHYNVCLENGQFNLDRKTFFHSVEDLVWRHWIDKTPLAADKGTELRRPIGTQKWELDHKNMERQRHLGAGAFSKVYTGRQKSDGTEVAVKCCEHDESQFRREEFLREARNMRLCGLHENICPFVGVSLLKLPLKIIIGVADSGDLRQFLCGHPHITPLQKVLFSLDAAKGLKHISAQGIVHMDVAARNCLVTTDREREQQLGWKFKVWIADFGLSRKTEEYKWETGDAVSQRWAAPELLKDNRATTKSDVWSFGILMWEIFSNGKKPYPEVEDDENLEIYLTTDKKRMKPDPSCPAEAAKLMMDCWELAPENRPCFKRCVQVLSTLCDLMILLLP